MKLSPYPKYRDPEWVNLENLPSHWDLLRNKYLFRISKEIVGKQADKYTLLSLTLKGIIPRDLDNPTGKFPAEFDSYQKVFPGDLVFCLFDIDETPRTVGFSKKNGMITGAYTVVRCFSWMNPEYLYFYYLFLDTHKGLRPFYTGLRKVIKTEVFLGLKTPVPPKEEQDQIVRFLNMKFTQIAKFIRNKRRLIKLFKEQKQALINQAVIRGIGPNAKIKPSGIDWLGDIPEHWDVTRLKFAFKKNIGGVWGTDQKNDEHDVVCVRVADFNYDFQCVRPANLTIRNINDSELAGRELSRNDIILEKSGGGKKTPVGRAVLYNLEYKAVCSNFTNKLEVESNRFDVMYLTLVLYSMYANGLTVFSIKQTTGIQNLDINNYFCNLIPLPPRKEQTYINETILKITKSSDDYIKRINKEIDLIKEFRSRLISDVVTGKLDVRNINVDNISDEEIIDGLSINEETQDLNNSIKEVSNEY